MEIPKYIEKLIDKRQRLALDLLDTDAKLCDWMEKNGISLMDPELYECVMTGCRMYVEPEGAAKSVREVIRNHNAG